MFGPQGRKEGVGENFSKAQLGLEHKCLCSPVLVFTDVFLQDFDNSQLK